MTRPRFLASFVPLLGAVSMAAVPPTINYQGRLTDLAGTPVSATLPMQFTIWTSLVGGSALWSETWDTPNPQVVVTSGIFSVQLGSHTPVPVSLFAGGVDRFLQVTVNGETLTPRQRLSSVAWSNVSEKASDAESLGGVVASSWQRRVAGSCPPGYSIATVNADGSVACEQDDVGIAAEVDPEVGALSLNRVPKWDGSKLVDGIATDDGINIGVAGGLQAAGTIESTSGGFRFPDGTVQPSAASTPASVFVHWGVATCPGSSLIHTGFGAVPYRVGNNNASPGVTPICVDAGLAGPWVSGGMNPIARVKKGAGGWESSSTSLPCAVCMGGAFTLWGRSTCPGGTALVYAGHLATMGYVDVFYYGSPLCLDDAIVATWTESSNGMTIVRKSAPGRLDGPCPCVVCQ